MVELALVIAFIYMPILVGVVGCASLIYYAIEVSNASHEGATYASQYFRTHSGTFPTNVATVAQAAEANVPSSMIVTPTVYCGCAASGSTAQITSGSCTSPAVTTATCSGATPLLFVTVNTKANVAPWISMKIMGLSATLPVYGSATFELAP